MTGPLERLQCYRFCHSIDLQQAGDDPGRPGRWYARGSAF